MRRLELLTAAAVVTAILVFAGCAGTAEYPAFDGSRAFMYLKQQVDSGPRVPGTRNHTRIAQYIADTLKLYADEVRQDKFKAKVDGKTLEFRNIYAAFNKDANDWILLCAHWDTRPTADEEIDSTKRLKPIPGANDGASGTAVLLEMARLLKENKPDVGVFMAFFDGEDHGPSLQDMFIGSEHFAKNLKTSAVVNGKPITFRYGILLDMVGDKNLKIYKELRSTAAAPAVVDKVWKAAADLGYDKIFIDEGKHDINDDHIPLIAAGVKTIDVIDFDYAYWHTLDDTVDKCSAESLEIVGRTITKVIYDERSSVK